MTKVVNIRKDKYDVYIDGHSGACYHTQQKTAGGLRNA